MIRQYIKGRVCVFIDAANIFYSQQTLKWKIDYQKLKKYLEKECDLVCLYFYTGKIGENHKQNKFIKKMQKYGYIVRSKEVKIIKVAPNVIERKGDLDAELIIDALKNINNFDTCILMSGDSDFASLIDELKQNKKWVIVISTRGHVAKELLERAKYIDLRKLKYELIFNQ
ncbi:MAG: hypothetical protein COX44_03270 [Candidatus Portnoybacteria bacterium CG23_combo_of_CG06-09_8_20_14_all_37_13]|uniref:NYN domain-containing protein n=2 Tax=Parcubacteria group TaxID=1794811 RepID=A0A1J4TZY7_9BACT|nr:MAG: hypothetical protein AUJ29_03160 [Candidatus Kuenenbacteria bacterium CG1_02_38_13]PIP16829.1 MAG: hypothetical protein COX44_03270 [Candidatus Portnoybacteria bacterium CG23_combo_of_CG06-09_8_20_14_all_37_13]